MKKDKKDKKNLEIGFIRNSIIRLVSKLRLNNSPRCSLLIFQTIYNHNLMVSMVPQDFILSIEFDTEDPYGPFTYVSFCDRKGNKLITGSLTLPIWVYNLEEEEAHAMRELLSLLVLEEFANNLGSGDGDRKIIYLNQLLKKCESRFDAWINYMKIEYDKKA